MPSAAVVAAQARRQSTSSSAGERDQWFIDKVVNDVSLTLKQRMTISMNWLRDKTVKHISVPVVKVTSAETGRVRVTQRSNPGQFPRADTTLLMKSIFADVVQEQDGSISGVVGTPVEYSIPLELTMNRRFLTRTLHEELANITRMLTGPMP